MSDLTEYKIELPAALMQKLDELATRVGVSTNILAQDGIEEIIDIYKDAEKAMLTLNEPDVDSPILTQRMI
jgi:hypothetical protein